MFSNIFQSLKEIGNPKIQDGQVIENPAETGTEKPVVLDEDGEVTEEGFVSIGRSSFYSLNNQGPGQGQGQSLYPSIPPPAMALPYYPPNPNLVNSQAYGRGQGHAPLQSTPSIEIAEVIRGLPMVLHPDLRPHVGLYDPQHVDTAVLRTPNLDDFNYDFEYERGVLRDISRQFNTN